eukprot:12888865-Prorocentrum_lima.AAC.1
MTAFCGMHSGRCQITGTTLPGRRAGQGRPLGWAWLSAANQLATAAEHTARDNLRVSYGYQARADARASLSQ